MILDVPGEVERAATVEGAFAERDEASGGQGDEPGDDEQRGGDGDEDEEVASLASDTGAMPSASDADEAFAVAAGDAGPIATRPQVIQEPTEPF